jgi:hypothetical protein
MSQARINFPVILQALNDLFRTNDLPRQKKNPTAQTAAGIRSAPAV